MKNLPITGAKPDNPELLGGLSDIHREDSDAVVSHYAIQPTFDVYATTQDADLGTVANAIQKVLDDTQRDLPPGATVVIRGQVETMHAAFSGLFFGLAEAIVLIYLLIVVNFHSWTDPFVIVMALPAALAGIAWTLFATHTSLSVPALDRRHHVHGRGDGEFDPGGEFRARAAGSDGRCGQGRHRGGRHPLPAGADDGAGHDHRHGADGSGAGRGRRAERAAGPRRDRRSDVRDLRHTVLCARPLRLVRGRPVACCGIQLAERLYVAGE